MYHDSYLYSFRIFSIFYRQFFYIDLFHVFFFCIFVPLKDSFTCSLSFSFLFSLCFFTLTFSEWQLFRAYKSSHWRCSVRKGFLRNFAKFIGKHLCPSLSFDNVADLNSFSFFHYKFNYYCVCVKRIMLCNCLCSSSPSSPSRDFASVIRNIGKFGTKNYFTDHRAANTICRFRDSVPVLKIHECC